MAGRLRRSARAAAVHRMVPEPSTGRTLMAAPSDRLIAIFSGVMPWMRRAMTGSTSRRRRKLLMVSAVPPCQQGVPRLVRSKPEEFLQHEDRNGDVAQGHDGDEPHDATHPSAFLVGHPEVERHE